MRIHPPSIPTKFHPDPSTNNGGVAIFTSVHKKKNKNKKNKVSGLLVRRCARTKMTEWRMDGREDRKLPWVFAQRFFANIPVNLVKS